MKIKFPFRKLKAVCTIDQVYDKKGEKTLDKMLNNNNDESSNDNSLITINKIPLKNIFIDSVLKEDNKANTLNSWFSFFMGMHPYSENEGGNKESANLFQMITLYNLPISYNIILLSETKVKVEYEWLNIKVTFSIEIVVEDNTKKVFINPNDLSIPDGISGTGMILIMLPILGIALAEHGYITTSEIVNAVEGLFQASWQYLK